MAILRADLTYMMKRLFYMCFVMLLMAACHQSQKSSNMNHKYTNDLVHETSPYLLQHAHNPVNWKAWNDDALKQSVDEDKLMIISVGYSACHWCHVMEHESFEDSTVAAVMNTHFVNIKVDREERPDIDDVYMTACQLASGRGCGWPLNAFALPGGRPIWAGTYFPKDQWINILEQFIQLKKTNPDKLEEYAKNIEEGFKVVDAVTIADENDDLAKINLDEAITIFKNQVDAVYGGRSGAPKFPMPNNYELLLKWAQVQADPEAEQLVYTTLDNMAQAGIFDPVVGGFARYAVDAQWKVPHFEKMLYDNGQLLDLYSCAYKKSKNPIYKTTIDKTISWIDEEMVDESGGFCSALDADSDGEEGKYYVWTQEEISSVLGAGKDFEIFKDRYEITTSGNWEHDKNILHAKKSIELLAEKYETSVDEINKSIEASLAKLKPVRSKRIRPGLDDKILTSWNALATHGLIEAFYATGNERARELAANNIAFLIKHQIQENGQLWRNFKEGKSTINAFLDDYALVIRALVKYYELTFDEEYLFLAEKIANFSLTHFSDDDTGLFFYTSDLDPPLVTRKRELSDNVIPASNSIMARNLLRLGQYLYNNEYLQRAEKMALNMKASVIDGRQPSFYSNWLQLYFELQNVPYEVAIVGPRSQDIALEWQSNFIPNAILLGGTEEGSLKLLKDKLQEGATMIYVCQNKVCKFPVEAVSEAIKLIE